MLLVALQDLCTSQLALISHQAKPNNKSIIMKMRNSIIVKIILGLCGLLILIPGAMALFAPETFTGRNGIDIAGNVALFNDYRSLGAMMMISGVVMILGIIHARMTFTSVVFAIGMHLSLSIGRLLSIGIDGLPPKGMIAAAVVEGILGLLAVFVLVKFKDNKEQ